MYTLTHLKTFVKVVELNNFSAAARHLFLTVAAVSKHVSQLETELKVKLMRRTTRKLMLTDIGHQFYLQCKKILSALEEADAVISQTQDAPTGKLRVKSERYFAERFIIPKLHEYHERYPSVKVELESAERVPNLIKEGFDVVFGRSLQESENVVKKTIANTHFTLCASPTYLKKHGHPTTPRELINHHYLSHSGRVPTDSIEFSKDEQIYIEPCLMINDSESLLQCALADMGIVKLQNYVVSQSIARGDLLALLSNYPSAPIPIYVFYEPAKYLQTKIKTFVEFMCQDLAINM